MSNPKVDVLLVPVLVGVGIGFLGWVANPGCGIEFLFYALGAGALFGVFVALLEARSAGVVDPLSLDSKQR